MNCTELYEWMADPSLLTKSTLQDLRQMMDDYPYFHAVRLLYLKNLAVIKDVRLEKELKKMSVFIPDRRLLYHLINGYPVDADKSREHKPASEKTKTEHAFEVIEVIEKIVPDDEPDEQDFVSRFISKPVTPQIASSDYSAWVAQNVDDIPTADGTGNRLKHQELIDSFIAAESKLSQRMNPAGVKKSAETTGEDEKPDYDPLENTSLDNSYFTETLARVYIVQKRYDKALEIIRVLSLKYPEKNRYFADQIRYLEKIINIKK